MTYRQPTLAIISQTIRRDLQAPLQLFTQIDIVHFYEKASYGDMKKEDFTSTRTMHFTGAGDLYAKLVSVRPTIVQAPEPWANQTSFTAAVTVWRYARRFHPHVIMPVFENRPLTDKLSPAKRVLVRLLIKRLDRHIDSYITLNDGARRLLKNIGIPSAKINKLLWGSWGINLTEFKLIPQVESIKYKTINKGSNIIFLGRVSLAKGIPMLVDAFRAVRASTPGATLTIAGLAGDAMDAVKGDAITYLGPLKNTDVPEYLRTGTVLVMPSQTTKEWEEQVGMVGLQSLACGTPVITTNSGAIPEYFKNGEGAVIIDEKDTDALVTSLKQFVSDPAYRARQSKKGREYIEKNFDVRAHIKRIETFLLKLKK